MYLKSYRSSVREEGKRQKQAAKDKAKKERAFDPEFAAREVRTENTVMNKLVSTARAVGFRHE